jgi:1-deoxy-D-xylulose-5-phosphate reductoisomerase
VIRVAVLGSTGSIGRSALEVVRRHPDRFEVVALTARRSADRLFEQVREFTPARAALLEPVQPVPPELQGATEWLDGPEALTRIGATDNVDVVVNALVGAAGLEPTIRSLEAGKRLALANKESLVAGGHLVLEAAERGGGEIVPIDSEHSALLQCLEGYRRDEVAGITLTASGGPFRGRPRADLAAVRPSDALRHPTWDMGAKITIDSATLANKALEVIEAHFLYGFGYDAIDAVVHPQSIVHSFVEFVDGSVLAQLGDPTMELPILYAMNYPRRVPDEALRSFDPARLLPCSTRRTRWRSRPSWRNASVCWRWPMWWTPPISVWGAGAFRRLKRYWSGTAGRALPPGTKLSGVALPDRGEPRMNSMRKH